MSVDVRALVSRRRMAGEDLLRLCTSQSSDPAAEQSSKQGDEKGKMYLLHATEDAWSPCLFAHVRQALALRQSPLRQLVKWRVEDSLVHAMCNVLPNLCLASTILATAPMVWLPAHLMGNQELRRGIEQSLAFVHRRPVGQMQRGPPPVNYLFVFAAKQKQKPFYWVPTRRTIDQWREVEYIGIPRVLFQIIGRMYPAYAEHYCSLFREVASDVELIDESRLARSIRLESLADDETAIPQAEAVRGVIDTLGHFSSVLLNGYCGSGKTVMMIEIVCRLGRKTAVLVNKRDLAEQWLQRFKQFAPGLRIKLVFGTHGDMTDCDVAICLMKSLFSRQELAPWDHSERAQAEAEAQRKFFKRGKVRALSSNEAYPWPWLASFGLVCVDEAHRVIAATSLPCLALFPNAQIVCATATPDRQDATHDSLGPVFGVAGAVLEQPLVALGLQIALHSSKCHVPVWKWRRKKYGGRDHACPADEPVDFEDVNYSRMVRELELDQARNEILLSAIWDAAAVKRRQTLVLGLIKSHLVALASALYARAEESPGTFDLDRLPCGLLFPETNPDIVDQVKRAQVIFATFQFASEAFDVGTLSALVLVSPYKSRLVQVLGRILRRKRGGQAVDERAGRVVGEGWWQEGKWGSLPIVYLCDDASNPWFHATSVKQTRLAMSTYEASVARVEPRPQFRWPENLHTLKERFLAKGQVSMGERLFEDQDDDEDLFGDREEEKPRQDEDDDDDDEDDMDWFE